MKTTIQIVKQHNYTLMLTLTTKNDYKFCKSNKEMIDKLIKEIGICVN